jgi:dynein heavy chain
MRFRPYDLVVVPRERLALYPEYFTVSANGVMMVRRGVQAEFVPLASWVRQASLFDLVSNIGFFKNYVTGRAFRRWHKASWQPRLVAAQKRWLACMLVTRPTATG